MNKHNFIALIYNINFNDFLILISRHLDNLGFEFKLNYYACASRKNSKFYLDDLPWTTQALDLDLTANQQLETEGKPHEIKSNINLYALDPSSNIIYKRDFGFVAWLNSFVIR